jgi:hypothetical protein
MCLTELTLRKAQAEDVRNRVLREMLHACKTSLTATLALPKGATCDDILCPLKQAGIIMKCFQAAELYPLPENEFSMHRSVKTYWNALKDVGKPYLTHMASSNFLQKHLVW